jgi:predicted Rossmann-fold nucleotide-binding protein
VLLRRDFWKKVIGFDMLVEEGTISSGDLEIFQYVETAKEAWEVICRAKQA